MSKGKIAPTINNAGVLMKVTKGMDDEIHRYKATNLPPEVNGNSSCFSRLHLSRVADDHVIRNEKDTDEYLRGTQRPAFAVEGEPDSDSGPPEERLEHLRRVRVIVEKFSNLRTDEVQSYEHPDISSSESIMDHLCIENLEDRRSLTSSQHPTPEASSSDALCNYLVLPVILAMDSVAQVLMLRRCHKIGRNYKHIVEE
ncbi:hypothetical protein NC651_028299 [Populus alba x Populus x berolinensis]|nr:hypothetical protein NC651_028299 [Populus alba x Populus x berolinensis]